MNKGWPYLLTIILLVACIPARPQVGVQTPIRQNKAEASKSPSPKAVKGETIIEYRGYTVSYNSDNRIPNWVSYELTADETDGPYSRKGKDFQVDISANVPQADAYDYRGSGWSRGHMAPAGDFKWDDQAMWETFYYTNCCPQDVKLNNGSWNVLENKVRSWARQFGCVSIITGPIVGKNNGGRIGSHGVVVPDAFFKALLTSASGGFQGIAFVMQNESQSQSLSESYMSINDLERITGFDFFSSLPDTVEEEVESKVDLAFWRIR